MKRMNPDALKQMAQMLEDRKRVVDPAQEEARRLWQPHHEKSQQRAYLSRARFPLLYGGRYSGKGYVAGNMAINHAYEEDDGLVVILVREKQNAKPGGIWDKIQKENLLLWKKKKGLRYWPETRPDGNYTFPILNKWGRYSWFHLRTCKNVSEIEAKMRGVEPTMILWDEVTTFMEPEFFLHVPAALGRRKSRTPQQLVCLTNPDDPDHWAFQKWFVEETENPDFETHLLPLQEVIHLVPNPDYLNQLKSMYRNNPVMMSRMVHSQWVAIPKGNAIFGKYFFPNIHLWPKSEVDWKTHKKRVMPNAKYPVLVGYDLGPANAAIVFMQWIPLKDGANWVIFDEAIYVDKRFSYERIVFSLLSRMKWWQDRCNWELVFKHISDKNAFDRTDPNGSTEAALVERLSKKLIKENPDEFGKLKPIQFLQSPKPAVTSRSSKVIEALSSNSMVIDRGCNSQFGVIKMMNGLVADKGKKGIPYTVEDSLTPSKTCKPFKHVFDAMTYVMVSVEEGIVSVNAVKREDGESRGKVFSA